jgi:hypothetical protein
MKQKYILAAAASVMLLNACSTSSKIKLVKPEEAANIRHVCIIKNPKVTRQADLDKLFAAALEKQGISSEILSPDQRQRLYGPECRYNLRYFRVAGNAETIRKADVILRTPDYVVSSLGYSSDDEKSYRTSPDLQRQVDGIVARLLGKKAE